MINLRRYYFHLSNVKNWPPAIVTASILLSAVIITVLIISVDSYRQKQNYGKLIIEGHELKLIVLKEDAEAKNIKYYQQQLSTLQKQAAYVKHKLPRQQTMPALIENIFSIAHQMDLEIKEFNPQEIINEDNFEELSINTSILGNYYNLAIFVSHLIALETVVKVDRFAIMPAIDYKNENDLTMIMTIKCHFRKELRGQAVQGSASSLLPLSQIETFKPYTYSLDSQSNPFQLKQATTLLPFYSELESYPLRDFKMVGTINDTKQIWALIALPTGDIQPIALGQYLGLSHNKVIQITNKNILMIGESLIAGKEITRQIKLVLSEAS